MEEQITKAIEEIRSDDFWISREEDLEQIVPCLYDLCVAIRSGYTLIKEEQLKEAYDKGYDYGVKDWFKEKTK